MQAVIKRGAKTMEVESEAESRPAEDCFGVWPVSDECAWQWEDWLDWCDESEWADADC